MIVTLGSTYLQTWFQLRLNVYHHSRGNISIEPILFFLPLKPNLKLQLVKEKVWDLLPCDIKQVKQKSCK